MIAIVDDGPGIPADQHDHVFKRFYRLEQSRYTPGNGLGLSLVAAGLGNSPVEMQHHSLGMARSTYALLKRLVPKTPMQWGVLAVAGSFVMLGVGAVLSLRKQPLGEPPPILPEGPLN